MVDQLLPIQRRHAKVSRIDRDNCSAIDNMISLDDGEKHEECEEKNIAN